MFLSLFLIIVFGFLLGWACKKIGLPALVGYMAVGVLFNLFSLIDGSILQISSEIRKIALLLILLRSGLTLSLADLKKVGRPALLMCFLPATLEILAVGLIAPLLFPIGYRESFLLGSVLGAVSPAVVSPRMIEMIENRHGTKDGVPQLLLAGASADDVYAVVLFTAFSSLAAGETLSLLSVAKIPLSAVTGIGGGVLVGALFVLLTQKFSVRSAVRSFLLVALAFGAVAIETLSHAFFSGLLCAVTMGLVVSAKDPSLAKALSADYNGAWVLAEVFLFVLVGASVNLQAFLRYLPKALLVIACGLALRMLGVALCCVKTRLTAKERLFAAVAYTPKATVQAALIGSLPLALASETSAIIVSVAVVAILLTAPVGAFAIDLTKNKLVPKEGE